MDLSFYISRLVHILAPWFSSLLILPIVIVVAIYREINLDLEHTFTSTLIESINYLNNHSLYWIAIPFTIIVIPFVSLVSNMLCVVCTCKNKKPDEQLSVDKVLKKNYMNIIVAILSSIVLIIIFDYIMSGNVNLI